MIRKDKQDRKKEPGKYASTKQDHKKQNTSQVVINRLVHYKRYISYKLNI